jgi:MOSC domain-containing protein YiiM
VVLVERASCSVAVTEITRLYVRDKDDLEGLRRIVDVTALPDHWGDYFEEQINRVRAGGHMA